MRTLLLVALALVVCLPAHSQFFYQSCLDVANYEDDASNKFSLSSNIIRNATGDIAMIGNLKVFRLTKDGAKSWEQNLTTSVQDFDIDKNGNVLVIHGTDNILTKYAAANGTSAWSKNFIAPTVADATFDDNTDVYVTGYDGPATSLYFEKFTSAGVSSWSKTPGDFTGLSVVTNAAGDVFVLTINNTTSGYTLFKYSSSGTFGWQKDINYTFTTGKVTIGPDGNVYTLIWDFSSTRLLKVQASDGAILEDQLFDIGKTIMAFRGNDPVLVGRNFNGDYTLVNYSSTFPPVTFLDYIDTYNAYDNTYSYVSLNIEADGTAAIAYTIEDQGLGSAGTLVRYSATGTKLNESIFNGPITGGILDYKGDYLVPTSQTCVRHLVPCSKYSITVNTAPQSQNVCPGANTTFTVAATGLNLLYQWKKDGVILKNEGHWSGVTTATLTITGASAVDDAGSYTCDIFDGCDHSTSTTAVTLGFLAGANITTQPTAVEACAGTEINFTIAATGSNLKYQWKKAGVALVDGTLVVGAKTNKLTLKTIAAGDAALYSCDVTTDCSAVPVSSQNASLTVLLPASITKQPAATASACSGSNLVLSLEASGANETYQWKKGTTNLVESATVTGSKTNTLTLKQLAAGDAGQYSCVVTGMCGAPVTSSATTVTLTTPSQITAHPVGKSVCANTNVVFSITATGTGLTYTWKKGNNVISNGGKYSGAGTATLTITAATAAEAGAYTCSINNPCGPELVSNAAQLTIDTAPSILAKSGDAVLCEGTVGKLSITPGEGTFTYQWKKGGVNLTDGAAVTGTTTNELLIISATAADAGSYTCELKSGCGNPLTSGAIAVTVNKGTAITAQPTTHKACEDEKIVLSITATGNALTYTWKKNGATLSDGGTVSGAKTTTLTIAHASSLNEGRYTCEVSGSCGGTAISDGIDVTLNPKPNLVLVGVVDCIHFQPEWSKIVTDTKNTVGQYALYKAGSTQPLTLMDISATGEYKIVKTTSACADTVVWNNTCVITGIAETQSHSFNVYPNPSNGSFQLTGAPATRLELYNVQGKLVHTSEGTGADGLVEASHLSDGLYWLVFPEAKGAGGKRVVIKH
ncbi:immunoglobulin domain-containing protein [Chryseolinea lacunae]|uniref:Immunoglobulin domain-containing protein n=1 Tax=Chryseolinea lacunae TaxID=2801331 RepID=A0ABS1KWM7_9BACT|nr:immunoglobulin domain-containing protein [Chryseolinea lacunae]MBL0743860.1 immunoglobulin domain-containing protein [Chryseolinea lacunae]